LLGFSGVQAVKTGRIFAIVMAGIITTVVSLAAVVTGITIQENNKNRVEVTAAIGPETTIIDGSAGSQYTAGNQYSQALYTGYLYRIVIGGGRGGSCNRANGGGGAVATVFYVPQSNVTLYFVLGGFGGPHNLDGETYGGNGFAKGGSGRGFGLTANGGCGGGGSSAFAIGVSITATNALVPHVVCGGGGGAYEWNNSTPYQGWAGGDGGVQGGFGAGGKASGSNPVQANVKANSDGNGGAGQIPNGFQWGGSGYRGEGGANKYGTATGSAALGGGGAGYGGGAIGYNCAGAGGGSYMNTAALPNVTDPRLSSVVSNNAITDGANPSNGYIRIYRTEIPQEVAVTTYIDVFYRMAGNKYEDWLNSWQESGFVVPDPKTIAANNVLFVNLYGNFNPIFPNGSTGLQIVFSCFIGDNCIMSIHYYVYGDVSSDYYRSRLMTEAFASVKYYTEAQVRSLFGV
jgi:hypothetical protein